MALINILPPQLADMIAAGEVVERPASVVKELVENALDAGAKNISVEIRNGGATYIRVTDDGCGMSPDDAGLCFTRHATSKLHDQQGLEAIGTMGFRGEALAAIASVSEVELITRPKGGEGTRVLLTAGEIQDMGPWGCPEGTTMVVKSLFFNTPARLKFMKSDRGEASACQLAALRCALGRPEVSIRFIKDGREEFFSPGDGKQESCLYALLGRDLAKDMLPCRAEDQGMELEGFISSPAAGRGNRSAQYFYCNGRFIRSALLQTAVEQAYKNSLLTGRFPACVLQLKVSLGSVDVNVHPAKTEIKFSQERQIFDLVYHAALSALQGEGRQKEEKKQEPLPPVKLAEKVYGSGRELPSAAAEPAPAFARPVPSGEARPQNIVTSFGTHTMRSPEAVYQTRLDMSSKYPVPPPMTRQKWDEKAAWSQNSGKSQEAKPTVSHTYQHDVENSVQNVESQDLPDHKIVGEAMHSYIIVEQDDELVFIDKHAAHERILFDRLKSQERRVMSQQLLCPVTIKLNDEDCELLEKYEDLLSQLGFELEPFGGQDYIIRALPADMLAEDARGAVEEICEKLRRGKAPDPASARDEILHTVACKAAIKAGWDTDPKELEKLTEAVLSGQVRYCPHGRPVSVRISRRELDKMFKRIV